ncbi:MAG: leucine-rich repeat protein [Clostridia bacterium]|jgi:hypothetical protein
MKKSLSIILSILIVTTFTLAGYSTIFAEQRETTGHSTISTQVLKTTPLPTGTPVPTPLYSGDFEYSITPEYYYTIEGLNLRWVVEITRYTGEDAYVIIPDTIDGYPVTSIGNSAFSDHPELTGITIPESVKIIGNNAFGYCDKLSDITIPDSVTDIGNCPFNSCNGLTQITVNNNANYASQDGVLFNKAKTHLIQYPAGKTGGYLVPDSVTNIGDGAFRDCSELTDITFPNSLTKIDSDAFRSCSKLTGIDFPDRITDIGLYAFQYCSGLTSVTIPKSVTRIGWGAFLHCDRLNEAYFEGNAPLMGEVVFNQDSSFKVYYINGNTGFTNPWHGNETIGVDILPPNLPPISISMVNVSKISARMKVGRTFQLTSVIYPTNASNKNVNWTSDSIKIATVSSTGKVTAKGPGTAIITVTTASGNKMATCTVTVIQPVKSVKLNRNSITLNRGKTFKLTATINPSNASNRKITWRSGNSKIATVSPTGKITAKSKGTTYIYVYTVDGKYTARCRVIIK